MNRVLGSAPPPTSATYAHAPPDWLRWGFRLLSGGMGCALCVLSWQDWAAMPWPARALAIVVGPALVGLSLWHQPWQRRVGFVADERGLYFPANELLVLSLRRTTSQSWLHVPWRHVHDLRLAREAGEDGDCLAFDVDATAEEAAAFFRHVGRPHGRAVGRQGLVSLAYGDSPPRPAATLKRLLSLKARGGA